MPVKKCKGDQTSSFVLRNEMKKFNWNIRSFYLFKDKIFELRKDMVLLSLLVSAVADREFQAQK